MLYSPEVLGRFNLDLENRVLVHGCFWIDAWGIRCTHSLYMQKADRFKILFMKLTVLRYEMSEREAHTHTYTDDTCVFYDSCYPILLSLQI